MYKRGLSSNLFTHHRSRLNMSLTAAQLNALFPLPSPPPSTQAPGRLPGITHESSLELVKNLKENNRKWHILFNDRGFHNHTSHHLLAMYQLGASGPLLDAAYKIHASYMRPAFVSPEPVTIENFHLHLGDEKFYAAYLNFFSSELLEKGTAAILEEWIFSPKANIEPHASGKPLQMLNRFLAGILHPLIHTGYGCEFGLLGMIAEGLAQTAVHGPTAPVVIPSSLGNLTTSNIPKIHGDVHALSIVARILADPSFSHTSIRLPPPEGEDSSALQRVLRLRGDALLAHVQAWPVDGADAGDVERKIEELFWMNALFFGVGGWAGRHTASSTSKKFKADFFLVHLVTSVLFLPSLVAYLSPSSKSTLLRTYLMTSLATWVSRGRPTLPIDSFCAAVSPSPVAPDAHRTKPTKGTLTPEDPAPNPWLPLIQSTLEHPDDHLCKLQRSLVHFAALYGTREAGHFGAVELEGAEVLDGTLFVRVAGLTAERLGWMREGGAEGEWDFDGFYH